MTQLMPLPLTVSCFSKIQIGFTFLVLAYLGSPGKRAIKRVCVRACVRACVHACVCKNCGVGVVICLEGGADCLHMVQLIHCIQKIHHLSPHLNPDWFYFFLLVACPGCPGKEVVKRV